MGIQISDNMRGIDLLCSLPNVNDKNIGATGASGSGNQTMWLASLDERIKAMTKIKIQMLMLWIIYIWSNFSFYSN